MSRIGKLPVQIPQGVKVGATDSIITVEGPKGKLTQEYKPDVSIEVKESEVIVGVNNDSKKANAYHGLYRQLISNMIAYHMQKSLNWGLAAALGGLLLVGVLALYWLYNKIVGIDNMKLG